MIFDRLEHANQYYGLGRGIETVLHFFERYEDDGVDLTPELSLEGDTIFLIGLNYTSGEEDGDKMEAHRKYIDVMYVVEGEEKFFHKSLSDVRGAQSEYDPADDCVTMPIDPDATQVYFPAGHIAIFFPQDAHLAAQLWQKPGKVRKWIAKVGIETL